jgi:ADP-ribosylglycohydrolase
MTVGIYGDITGKLPELSHFAIWKLCPKGNKEAWRISEETKQRLLQATKQPSQEVLLTAWREHAPEHMHDLERRMNESGLAFTDDTLMEIATMDALLKNPASPDFKSAYLYWGRKYPNVGFGTKYSEWLASSDPQPYRSFGNGSAMRVGPIGLIAGGSVKNLERLVVASCAPTHNHPEAVRGALAVARMIWEAESAPIGTISKEDLSQIIEKEYFYDLRRTCAEIRKDYRFYSTSKESVSEAIVAFLESTDVQSAIDNAISLGGDADTMAMMAGNIAQSYYRKVPTYMLEKVQGSLPGEMLEILFQFEEKYFKQKFAIVH